MTRAVQWVMKRNCSFTPKQLLSVYLAVSAIALVIGTVFWWHGAVAVLPFAGVECLVLGIAFLACTLSTIGGVWRDALSARSG
jgi:uncharacterized membrane protein